MPTTDAPDAPRYVIRTTTTTPTYYVHALARFTMPSSTENLADAKTWKSRRSAQDNVTRYGLSNVEVVDARELTAPDTVDADVPDAPAMVDLADVIGALDVADMAGVSSQAVANWRKRHPDFPRPIHHVSNGTPLFSRRAVAAWLTSRKDA